jgi:peptide-methionine (S)-S-oxide reductase
MKIINLSIGLIKPIVLVLALFMWSGLAGAETLPDNRGSGTKNTMEQIILGGGCFWCMEAVFQSFRGVDKVESGFAGGSLDNPTYDDVVGGDTGHAEVVRVVFNPSIISLKQILTIFFHAHDPTTKDRQGNDVGPQYRSLILYSSDEQREVAEKVKNDISQTKLWGGKAIVTEVSALKAFYKAEEYHQNYYKNNSNRPYCLLVVGPKVQKIKEEFRDLLKE